MLKKAIALALIILAIYWSFFALMPIHISDLNTKSTAFSSERALIHLKNITKKPHYVGSPEHEVVKNYLIKALNDLGLEIQVQEVYSHNKKWGSIVKPKNILARIKGHDNSKALLLLSHYDSKSHASFGASDAGSGVVTILEGIRAYLSEGKTPRNDIIILFSDAEELGLNGADIFVNQHPWAKDIGLVLNFEARGSGGPSYMLIETNGGNQNLIKGFKEANPDYPVANSLAYSIYKMLPNDTDLTYFREDGDIDGLNFAFIDDHYDYHTALDSYERLDRNTLEHQGSYLMPLLSYFSEANLNNLKSTEDSVYFNVPLFKMVSYPNSWILPMLVLAILIFCALVFYGINKRSLNAKHMAIGFLPGIGALLINGIVGYFGWKLLLAMYPHYGEILHGFPYNGHLYIWVFALFSTAVCMWLYNKVYKPENTASLAVPPLLLWLIICGVVAFKLKGASFFIIPVYFGLLSLFVLVRQKRPDIILMTFLLFPLLLIMSPFIKMFPVGLGLKTIVATTLLVSLMFSLCITVFGFSRYKNRWAFLLFFAAFGCFVAAHFQSDFNEERPKPNSLVYLYDADTDAAHWATYDKILDDWTQAYLTEDPDAFDASSINFESKYGTQLSYSKKTVIKPLKTPYVDTQKDTVIGDVRHLQVFISPQRTVNTLEFYADDTNTFLSFNINGLEIDKSTTEDQVFTYRFKNRLFSYMVTDHKSVELNFTVPAAQKTSFQIFEVSFDLLENELFRVAKRPNTMIPKPFVLNDAIIIKKTISFE
ncbi:M28 family peptidase [Gelidibacter salicanalis]|uniref:Vacuolar membrane protease n=1 Tax=Gelidibacter salicanalis TaxID=291193 RepID=A0A934KQR2_9FLAO|nr:M28 family peptidase [Gelidibacter salicanalis]MBJ7882094.1 M28 family peptidase [Gelidibacter salicanalis]